MYIGRPAYIEQLNDISFWYPILDKIGMRTPETYLFYAPHSIGKIIDGDESPEFGHLVREVERTREQFGGTAFLRTGHTSNKHEWADTCCLSKDSDVGMHIAQLVEFSMLVDLPYTTWAVRRMIDTTALTVAFKNMPIAREVRLFASKGELLCAHPYWPDEAFRGTHEDDSVTDEQLKQLQEMPDLTELTQMAQYVSRHFGGAWSIDFLQDADGKWWLTDMALASTSYHWPGCDNEEQFKEVGV